MKLLVVAVALMLATTTFAQLESPKLSPEAETEQMVGLTEVEIEYSRPAMRGRQIFGKLVPYGEIWRTGANKNTVISFDKDLLFGKDTLAAGSYALYVKPEKTNWTIYFYTDTENWGTPDEWEDSKVALELNADVKMRNMAQESFTIALDDVTPNSASLSFSWDEVYVKAPFQVFTKAEMAKNIKSVMAGPSSGDYYRAADYLLAENMDLENALKYMDKALSMRDNKPFWMLRKKSLIQAGLKDYKGAIQTAKESMKLAKEAGNSAYVKMNEESIAEWEKM
jgi:tetratricopeptide (TPR) repeat protein